MGTSIDVPIDLFLRRIEKDKSFFEYYNLLDFEALALARQRAENFLEEAIYKVTTQCSPQVDFLLRDGNGDFTFDWNAQEKDLIPSVMYEVYLDRDFAYLKTLNVNFTSTELKVFDPSNARSTFLDIYERVHKHNQILMALYKDTDRETGELKQVDFSKYDFS